LPLSAAVGQALVAHPEAAPAGLQAPLRAYGAQTQALYGTAPPVAPAPAPAPSFMTPAMQQYVDAFHASQGAQQQAINSGLAAALQGLGARRDAAAKSAAALPGQYQAAYDQATQAQQAAAQQASAAFGNGAIGGNAYEGLISAANANERAAGTAAQPLLEAGITADYSQGQTALQNTHMANQAAVSDANLQFQGEMAKAQADWQQHQDDLKAASAATQAGYKHDEDMARLRTSLGLKEFAAEHPEKSNPSGAYNKARNEAAQQAGFHNFNDYRVARQQGAYSWVENALGARGSWEIGTGKSKRTIDTSTPEGIQALGQYIRQTRPDVYKALAADGVLPPVANLYALGAKK
jgi:hypothetical protein